MKTIIYKSDSRGNAHHGWLKSRHTFSFANYYNPERVHFGLLRVFNDDIVQGGEGFGSHSHDNMEIVSIPLKGELAHKDSTGTKEVIRTNDVQIMSAGSGLTHSEFNNSGKDEVNFLQIWVLPKEKNITPRYEQKTFNPEHRQNKFESVVSPKKNGGALWINQDSYFSLGSIEAGNSISYKVKQEGNGIFLFVIKGKVETINVNLEKRDAIGIEDSDEIEINAKENSELLLIEIPMH